MPSSKSTIGFQSKVFKARLMSGLLCRGSSIGNGSETIFELEFVRVIIFSASDRIVFSFGFPKLIGPVTLVVVNSKKLKSKDYFLI